LIILLRHGRTEANAQGLLLGRADPVLDELGRTQAAAAGAALSASADVRRIVTSPLARCRATAEIVAGVVGAHGDSAVDVEVDVEVDERWIELDYGELDGTPVADVPAATWATWQADLTWAPPGGESHEDLGERVRAACDDLTSPPGGAGVDDGDVLVVSHVSPIKAAVAWALGVGDEVAWHLFLAPASITRIAPPGGRSARRSLHTFNETAHLR
jgi:broad specificity phosphatase PhoE